VTQRTAWCGPCQAELPHLQKLYEKVKDRTDLQILTLNIDEDPGLVAPFLKENNCTFPVLPAYAFVFGLLDVVGIPQNWIVDSRGEWRWTGGPDLTNSEWKSAILKQLEYALHAEGVRVIRQVLGCSMDDAKAVLHDLRSRKLIDITITPGGELDTRKLMSVAKFRWERPPAQL
jgi:thiol-disulfide isomerase/thioredoxin